MINKIRIFFKEMNKMKKRGYLQVLHINKVHHMLGGAEAVYFTTAEILKKHGHQSIFFSMKHSKNLPADTEKYFVPFIDLDNQSSFLDYIKASFNVFYSFNAKRHLARLLDEYEVDIVHIHNIHRQMSPSILHELKKRDIPVVMTLHEHKMVCPSFLLLAHGRPCEACRSGKYYNAVKIRCVKGKFLRSLLASLEAYLHFKFMDIYKNVDIFIAPSMFLKRKHEEMGFKKEIVHLPYPLDLKKYDRFRSSTSSYNGQKIKIAYFGRLVKEKGLYTLIDAIVLVSKRIKNNNKPEFKIIGEGPIKKDLNERLNNKGIMNVSFIGFLEGDNLYREISKMHIIIVPSEWYENYPVSVMESFALGRPVIGSRIGGIPELVRDGESGLTFKTGDAFDLSEKIEYMINNRNKIVSMGEKARKFAERVFDSESHYPRLMEIYTRAIQKHKK